MIQVHFQTGVKDTLATETIIRWLCNVLDPFWVVVGQVGTMSSSTARLVETNSAHSGYRLRDLCTSARVISNKLLLVETHRTAEEWNARLTDEWRRDPATAAEKLMRRPSDRLPGTIAQVQATQNQIAVARNTALHAEGPDAARPDCLRATLELPLGTSGPCNFWMPHFMKHVGDACQLELQQAPETDALDWHRWRPIMNFDGGWSGKIVVQLRNRQELTTMHATIQGRGARILDHVAAINLSSDHIGLGIHH